MKHTTGPQRRQLQPDSSVRSTGCVAPPSAGVAFLFNSSAVVLSSAEVVKGRLFIVRAEKCLVFCFVNIYAPNSGWERVAFFVLLEK